jgi:hypothetical protein
MQDRESLTPAEEELASALGGLRPAAAAIDRDRMMFRAGQASAKRRSLLWQGTTVGLVLTLGVSLLARPAPREIERIVYVAPADSAAVSGRLAGIAPGRQQVHARLIEASYLKLRNEVLAHGFDALSDPMLTTRKTPSSTESLKDSPPTPQEAPSRQRPFRYRDLMDLGEHL